VDVDKLLCKRACSRSQKTWGWKGKGFSNNSTSSKVSWRWRCNKHRSWGHGIAVVGNGSNADIFDNVVTGFGSTEELNQTGILVGFGAKATGGRNRISENKCNMPSDCGPDPINQGQSVGIFTFDADVGTKIWNNNIISNNDVGIYLYSSSGCCTTEHNTLTNNRFFGLVIQDGDNIVSYNTVSGGSVGIAVVADSVNTVGTLQNNTINGTSVRPIQEISSEDLQQQQMLPITSSNRRTLIHNKRNKYGNHCSSNKGDTINATKAADRKSILMET
jgi:parallel beta-helix repeat protein